MASEVDGRRARGDITRHKVARHAADVATVSGLDSISMGRLAAGAGVSKSGILTVFENREQVQLAAVAAARERFVEHVVAPAWDVTPGVPRLRAFVTNWYAYLEARVFPGGCFLAATSSEFGGRRGPVPDAVRDLRRTWLQLLEGELAVGRETSREARGAAKAAAFRLDAYMQAANQRHQLFDDPAALELGRDLCLKLLQDVAVPPAGS